MNEYLKPAKLVILTLFLLLLAGSLFFYKERILFIDAPHILFDIINKHSLQISVGRYGSFITQIVPLIGLKLHLPLRSLMILYSAGFNLFFIAVLLLLLYKYKRYDLALIFGFYLTLFVSDTYFWTNNEVHQGIAWLIFAFGINFYSATKKRSPVILLPLFILSFFLAIWTHPLVMIAALYLWFFYWVGKIDWPYSKTQPVVYTVVLVLLVFLKYHASSANWYDGDRISKVTDFHFIQLASICTAPVFSCFLKGCITNYWLFIILFITGILALLKEKKYLLFALTICFSVGYLLLICIIFRDTRSLNFYIESEYTPLAIIGTAPFIYFVLPYFKGNKLIIILIFIFAVRLVYIVNASTIFTNRIALLEKVNEKMRQKKITKAVIPDNGYNFDSTFIMHWALPVESMMLSKLNNDVPQRTIIIADTGIARNFMHTNKDTLWDAYERVPYSKINTAYFQFDTSCTYRVITYAELMQ